MNEITMVDERIVDSLVKIQKGFELDYEEMSRLELWFKYYALDICKRHPKFIKIIHDAVKYVRSEIYQR